MEQTSKNVYIIVAVAVIITVIVVGNGVYFWQKSVFEKTTSDLEQQINNLQNQISKLEDEKLELAKLKTDLQLQIINQKKDMNALISPEFPLPPGYKPLSIISPKKGDNLCLGKLHNIEWSGSPGIQSVELMVRQAGATQLYILGSFPVSYNETGEESLKGLYPWKVGTTQGEYGGKLAKELTEGPAYEILVQAIEKSGGTTSRLVSDTSGIFAITRR